MNFTQAMLVLRLLVGGVSSLCAGFVAAWIARRNGTAVKMLAGLSLVAFIPVHYMLWERFPVWYHLIFLLSLVVLTMLGAAIRTFGAHFRSEIVSGPGGKQILANDPSGNPIELFEPADA